MYTHRYISKAIKTIPCETTAQKRRQNTVWKLQTNCINGELLKINQWLGAKLSLNVTKTKFMVFHMHNKSVSYPDLQINGNKIERVTEFNFLGLVLQSNLSWNKHINHISLKVSKAIGIIHRLKSVYPLSVLLTLYNTLVLPHFNYCILSWGSVVKENHHLYLLQKKAVRIITQSNYIAHTKPLCKQHNLIKLTDMFSLAIWKFYYKLMNNQLPTYFSRMKPVLPIIIIYSLFAHIDTSIDSTTISTS